MGKKISYTKVLGVATEQTYKMESRNPPRRDRVEIGGIDFSMLYDHFMIYSIIKLPIEGYCKNVVDMT